ncbi:MAG: hypothetical protein ACRDFX_12775 [Chloroflexota bacterium]
MRRVRPQRRGLIDRRTITIGDYIVLAASLLTVISLFLPWFVSTLPHHSEWAFTYSEWAAVVVIVFFLASIFLVIYPGLSPDLRFPALPFSTPLVFMTMGGILLLIFTYELGKYDCIECQGAGRGFGVWVAWFASIVYIIGATIKWGAKSAPRTYA